MLLLAQDSLKASLRAVGKMRQPVQPAVGYSRDTDAQLCVCTCTTGHLCTEPDSREGKVAELRHLCAQMQRAVSNRGPLAGRAYTDAHLGAPNHTDAGPRTRPWRRAAEHPGRPRRRGRPGPPMWQLSRGLGAPNRGNAARGRLRPHLATAQQGKPWGSKRGRAHSHPDLTKAATGTAEFLRKGTTGPGAEPSHARPRTTAKGSATARQTGRTKGPGVEPGPPSQAALSQKD